MVFVSRAEWGAEPSRGPTRIPGPIRGVTCHWEGPALGWPWAHELCAQKVRAIQRYHQVNKGWSDIAYNALCCGHGSVFVGRGLHVRSAANGESNIGGNDQWYAICYLAGVGDEFTAQGQAAMLEAIAWLRKDGDAGDAVNGHRDHHPTACPGAVIYRWVQSGIPPATSPILEDDEMQLSDKLGRGEDAITVRQLFQRLDRFMASSAAREKKLLDLFTGLPEEIATAVEAELRATIPGTDTKHLRALVYTQAARALNDRLGSLDEPT